MTERDDDIPFGESAEEIFKSIQQEKTELDKLDGWKNDGAENFAST